MALRGDDVDLGRDRALVVRFQDGDGEGFDDLYRRYFDRLRRFCERRVGDPHEAEELAQEAFARALRAMPGFAGERRFYPWMTVIASRLCVDAHRRRKRSTPVADVEVGSVELDVEDLFAEVDREQLERALGRLAPRHRDVLDLREHHGWTYQRIADHYDVTLGTVEALLHRARRALRREFDKVATGGAAFAWLTRRFDGLRTRATAQLGDLATPLSATVASVALAAGSVAIADAPGAHGPPPARRALPPVVSVAGGQRASSSTVTLDPTPDPTPFVVASATRTATAGSPRDVARPIPTVERVTPDDARARTADAGVRSDLPGLGGVAIDPASAVGVATDVVSSILRRNP